LEQVELCANTYGNDMISCAMPKLLKDRTLSWFIANSKQWATCPEFIFFAESLLLSAGESSQATGAGLQWAFKDFMIDMQTMMRSPWGARKPKIVLWASWELRGNIKGASRDSSVSYQISDERLVSAMRTEFEER